MNDQKYDWHARLTEALKRRYEAHRVEIARLLRGPFGPGIVKTERPALRARSAVLRAVRGSRPRPGEAPADYKTRVRGSLAGARCRCRFGAECYCWRLGFTDAWRTVRRHVLAVERRG